MRVVRCGHCGASVQVNAWREPLSYAEREADHGRRKLVIIGGDGLLHECIIDEKKAHRARASGPAQPSRPTQHASASKTGRASRPSRTNRNS